MVRGSFHSSAYNRNIGNDNMTDSNLYDLIVLILIIFLLGLCIFVGMNIGYRKGYKQAKEDFNHAGKIKN
jgi:hypothetical protein